MSLTAALDKLHSLSNGLFSTDDVATALQLSPSHASRTLSRLSKHDHVIRRCRGKWALNKLHIEPWLVSEFLISPWPSYISLYSALFHHGMIEQIPEVHYAVTLAKTKKLKTPKGTFSYHQVSPQFFFGFESHGRQQIKMARPEKALMDVFYLSPNKTKLFKSLPELELPSGFKVSRIKKILKNIPRSSGRRKLVEQALERYGVL